MRKHKRVNTISMLLSALLCALLRATGKLEGNFEFYTGNFSAPVSTQPHGILIEFAPYVDGQACNGESYNIYIDPWCSKWIYVYDDKIVGNDANSKTGTTNGISYNNRKYVLSRVYGV